MPPSHQEPMSVRTRLSCVIWLAVAIGETTLRAHTGTGGIARRVRAITYAPQVLHKASVTLRSVPSVAAEKLGVSAPLYTRTNHAFTHTHTHTSHTHTPTKQTHKRTHKHTHTQSHTSAHTRMYTLTHSHKHTHTQAHTSTHKHTHTRIVLGVVTVNTQVASGTHATTVSLTPGTDS